MSRKYIIIPQQTATGRHRDCMGCHISFGYSIAIKQRQWVLSQPFPLRHTDYPAAVSLFTFAPKLFRSFASLGGMIAMQ